MEVPIEDFTGGQRSLRIVCDAGVWAFAGAPFPAFYGGGTGCGVLGNFSDDAGGGHFCGGGRSFIVDASEGVRIDVERQV